MNAQVCHMAIIVVSKSRRNCSNSWEGRKYPEDRQCARKGKSSTFWWSMIATEEDELNDRGCTRHEQRSGLPSQWEYSGAQTMKTGRKITLHQQPMKTKWGPNLSYNSVSGVPLHARRYLRMYFPRLYEDVSASDEVVENYLWKARVQLTAQSAHRWLHVVKSLVLLNPWWVRLAWVGCNRISG